MPPADEEQSSPQGAAAAVDLRACADALGLDLGVAAERQRSRSPRGFLTSPPDGAADAEASIVQYHSAPSSQTLEFPSFKLGQLLGFKGATIQKIKERSGVQRLHIHDKELAPHKDTTSIEAAGTAQQVADCKNMLESLVAGDQGPIGHAIAFVDIDPAVVGKCMGYKGQTVKEMTRVSNCYIEIQQEERQGAVNGPRLFIAGPPEQVVYAVDLVNRFVESPGSRLHDVLSTEEFAQLAAHQGGPGKGGPGYGSGKGGPGYGSGLGATPSSSSTLSPEINEVINSILAGAKGMSRGSMPVPPPLVPSPMPSNGGKVLVQLVIDIPASKKGHLLGFHGQTIEKVRSTSGVVKCHLVTRDGEKFSCKAETWETIQVQILGDRDRVLICEHIVRSIALGDFSSLGFSTHIMPLPVTKASRLLGQKGGIITTLKNLTNIYLDVQQGPNHGVPAGEARLFMSGPPDLVERAKMLCTAFAQMMDHVPTGAVDVNGLSGVLAVLAELNQSTGGPPAYVEGVHKAPAGYNDSATVDSLRNTLGVPAQSTSDLALLIETLTRVGTQAGAPVLPSVQPSAVGFLNGNDGAWQQALQSGAQSQWGQQPNMSPFTLPHQLSAPPMLAPEQQEQLMLLQQQQEQLKLLQQQQELLKLAQEQQKLLA